MVNVTLFERVVERCLNVISPNYKQVVKMEKRLIDGFVAYNSNFIPRIGETIVLPTSEAYDVVNVIYKNRKLADGNSLEVILEVVPHISKHTFNTVIYSFEEDWPLVSDLELEDDK